MYKIELSKSLPTLQILSESNGLIKDQLTRFLTRAGAHYNTHFQLVLWMQPRNLTILLKCTSSALTVPVDFNIQHINVFWILTIWLHDCKISQQFILCPDFHENCFINSRTNFLVFICVKIKPGSSMCVQNQNTRKVSKELAATKWDSSKRSVKPYLMFLGELGIWAKHAFWLWLGRIKFLLSFWYNLFNQQGSSTDGHLGKLHQSFLVRMVTVAILGRKEMKERRERWKIHRNHVRIRVELSDFIRTWSSY